MVRSSASSLAVWHTYFITLKNDVFLLAAPLFSKKSSRIRNCQKMVWRTSLLKSISLFCYGFCSDTANFDPDPLREPNIFLGIVFFTTKFIDFHPTFTIQTYMKKYDRLWIAIYSYTHAIISFPHACYYFINDHCYKFTTHRGLAIARIQCPHRSGNSMFFYWIKHSSAKSKNT